jgi:hypothetical protein
MLGKIKIDFQVIESGDTDIIMIGDFSNWLQIENRPAVISIVPPGSTRAVEFNFDKRKINGFNSENLGLDCCTEGDSNSSDLPDGIYDIKLEASPNTFFKQRYYLKLDNTKLILAKLVIKLGFNYNEVNKQELKSLVLIDSLLMDANYAILVGEVSKAYQNFTEALRLIEKIKSCKNC